MRERETVRAICGDHLRTEVTDSRLRVTRSRSIGLTVSKGIVKDPIRCVHRLREISIAERGTGAKFPLHFIFSECNILYK